MVDGVHLDATPNLRVERLRPLVALFLDVVPQVVVVEEIACHCRDVLMRGIYALH